MGERSLSIATLSFYAMNVPGNPMQSDFHAYRIIRLDQHYIGMSMSTTTRRTELVIQTSVSRSFGANQ